MPDAECLVCKNKIRLWKTLKQYTLEEISIIYVPYFKFKQDWDNSNQDFIIPLNEPNSEINQEETLPTFYT